MSFRNKICYMECEISVLVIKFINEVESALAVLQNRIPSTCLIVVPPVTPEQSLYSCLLQFSALRRTYMTTIWCTHRFKPYICYSISDHLKHNVSNYGIIFKWFFLSNVNCNNNHPCYCPYTDIDMLLHRSTFFLHVFPSRPQWLHLLSLSP